MTVTKDVITLLSRTGKNGEESIRKTIYSGWNEMLSSIDNYPEKHKLVAIQAISEVFASFGEEALRIDNGILHILTNNMLLLKSRKSKLLLMKMAIFHLHW